MNKRFWLLGCVLFLVVAQPLFARDKTDVLVMRNGDHVQCEVKGLDAGVLYVSLDWADGTVSVDWTKVERLESTQLFVVRTSGGVVYTGALRTPKTEADRPMTIQVLPTPEQPVTINSTQVVSMIATSDKFWRRFNGELSFGSIFSKANNSAQYSLGSQTAYVRERWTAAANYQSSLSSSSGDSTSARNSVKLAYEHLLRNENWFYSALGDFLQSNEQQISLQTTVGGGVGRYLKNTNKVSIALLGGGAWQSTNYNVAVTPFTKEEIVAALIYGNVKFFKFSKTNLDLSTTITPALNDPGRVRFDTNASYYIKIIGNLNWNVSFYGNWDNRPPSGIPGSDYGSSSGLSWTYGLK
jgi:hypothetical protein